VSDLRTIARKLDGEVSGDKVLCPGPNHSKRDRSLSIRFERLAPEGFTVLSFCGDDIGDCRDYVREQLGLPAWKPDPNYRKNGQRPAVRPVRKEVTTATATTTADAMALWREAVDPHHIAPFLYFVSRKLELDDDLCGRVLRWHEQDRALLALFRNILTDTPQAVSRVFIDDDGNKHGRRFYGPTGEAAIKLDPDDSVAGGLFVGEGVETCLSARQLGLRPVWALGSAGAIRDFPVLDGVECLTLLQENDANGASQRVCEACAARWHASGREVIINTSNTGNDLNDALRGAS
jgi:putative DNA primase/helicase